MKNNSSRKPAIFVDRDGTLIEEVNFLSRVEDLLVFPFTRPAIETLRGLGYLILVLTNQSGIGRGIYDESDMKRIHDEIQSGLDGMIDAFYFCPHLPCDGCRCRKPGLGMFESAARDFEIDMAKSWMIGDKRIDIEAGQNAGVSTALVLTGYGQAHQHLLEQQPTVISSDLGDAVRHITDSNSAKIVV